MDRRIAIPRLRLAYLACNTLLSSLTDYAMSSRFRVGSFFTSYKVTQRMVTREQKMKDAMYLAYLGISLTSFMASALFVMVSFHPKDPSYAGLPILYAFVCVGVGIATNVLASVTLEVRPAP